ncbi:hypothetical protein ACQYZS_29275, partial [Pseudomonas aeruginosa]
MSQHDASLHDLILQLLPKDGSSIGNIKLQQQLSEAAAFSFSEECSGQPIPDSGLSFSSATAGGSPSLN